MPIDFSPMRNLDLKLQACACDPPILFLGQETKGVQIRVKYNCKNVRKCHGKMWKINFKVQCKITIYIAMLVIVFCQFNTSQSYLQKANEKINWENASFNLACR